MTVPIVRLDPQCRRSWHEVEDLRAFDGLVMPATAATAPATPSLLARLRAMFSGRPLGWIAAAAAAVVVIALLPRFSSQPRSGAGTVTSLLRATRALDANPEGRLSAERIARLRAMLDGTAPRPTAVGRGLVVPSVLALSPGDLALWRWAQTRLAGEHLLLGAIAEDLGLLVEARAEYQRALDADPTSPDARRLLDALK